MAIIPLENHSLIKKGLPFISISRLLIKIKPFAPGHNYKGF